MAGPNDGEARSDYRRITASHFLRRNPADFGYDWKLNF
jgi:hypothetical protein